MTAHPVRPYVAPIAVRPAGADDLVCRRCHRRVAWGSFEVCTWWPNGCTAQPTFGPRPQVCWDCCDEHERLDLVDRGCAFAIQRVRGY